MRKLLSFVLLAVVVTAIAWFAFSRRGPAIAENSTLYLRIRAPFSETGDANVLAPLVGETPTLRDVIGSLQRAAADSHIHAVVIMPDARGAMWAQLQEVRAAILQIRRAGKPVVAYLENSGASEYYLASAADRILLMPTGDLDLAGVATYELFFRGTLDKIGVRPDLLHIGEFKTYSNTFTEKGMTAAHREMNAALNRDAYNELVRAIAEGRHRSEADVRAALDQGPFTAAAARDAGLVDGLAYEDQIDDAAPVAGTHRVEGSDYAPVDRAGFRAPKIAVLYAVGEITSGPSSIDSSGGFVLGSETFTNWIRTARADRSVRAIVVRIDSPGGDAAASEVIRRELMLTRDVKPLVVSMGDVAASGGYYIALPAQAIVAQPGTLTGSIGVVTGKFVVAGALEKLGIGTGIVSDGAMAQINSPFRPFTPEERARVESRMQTTYDEFIARVAAARHSTAAKIDGIAQGRVWTGRQARALGLVDALGGLDDALALAKSRANIAAGTAVALDIYPQRRGLLDVISNPFGLTSGPSARLGTLGPMVGMLERLTRFRPGEPLMLMPSVYLR